MAADEALIPLWAADLREHVAEIRGLTARIPDLIKTIEELRANTVPMSEHLQLMNRVEELWNRDLGARSDWNEMTDRVPLLWAAHVRGQGVRATYRLWLGALSVAVAVLTAFTLLHNLGIGISIH